MSYTKTAWADDVPPYINAVNLNNIEAGIEAAALAPLLDEVRFVDAGAASGGDGASWTTAYTAIQTAVDALTAGGTIYVAPGTYAPVTISKRLRLIGHGAAVIDVPSGQAGITCSVTGSSPVVGPIIEGFQIDASSGISANSGIKITGMSRATFRQLRIANQAVGIDFYNDASLFTERIHVYDTLVNNCSTGLRFYRTATGAQSFSYNRFDNLAIDACTAGIDIGGSSPAVPALYGSSFNGCTVWQQVTGASVLINGDMKGVQAHIDLERQAGASTTGWSLAASATNLNRFTVRSNQIGVYTTWVDRGASTQSLYFGSRTRADISATGQGFTGQTFERALAQGTTVATAGVCIGTLIPLKAGDVVTNIILDVGTLADSACTLFKVAVFTKDAVSRLGISGNAASAVSSTPAAPKAVVIPLTAAYSVTADDVYFLAFVTVGGTSPALLRGVNLSAHNVVVGSGARPCAQLGAGGQTDMPAAGASVNATGIPYWVAWS